mgnify:CR=1 FL=1
MKNNITMLNHPTMQRKIRNALWMAKMTVKLTGRPAKQFYIQNRFGRNIMRLDMAADGQITVWGDCSKNITAMVESSIYMNRRG